MLAPQQQGLLLQRYSSNVLHGSEVLAALSAARLKQLDIYGVDSLRDLAAGLWHLQDLEVLQVHLQLGNFDIFVPAINSLSKLTALAATVDHCNQTLLPQQLQRLVLTVCEGSSDDCVELQHLTQLTSLQLSMLLFKNGGLPTQLRQLTIFTPASPFEGSATKALQLTALRQLQCLVIHQPAESDIELLELGCLPELQQLALIRPLRLSPWDKVPVWSQVQHLKGLDLDLTLAQTPSELQEDKFYQILEHVTALTGLTCLAIYSRHYQKGPFQLRSGVCQHIAKLQYLQELALLGIVPMAGEQAAVGDIQHLSVLTGLTRLKIHDVGHLVTESTFAALAANIKCLQRLELKVDNRDMMRPIRTLTGLKHLTIEGLDRRQQQRWYRYLTGLEQLTQVVFVNASHPHRHNDSSWADCRTRLVELD